ncbi:MAG: NAD(P)-dependent oxidoreductase [Acidimicrobiales bacterium]
MSAEPLPSIGFIGLGAMGTPMTRRLMDAGYVVTGFDVAGDARARVAEYAVRTVDHVEEAVSRANVVILMLPDSSAVESVLTSTDVRRELARGTLVIDMSSSEPLRTRALAERLSEGGVRMIDAPVSGGVAGAERGALTVMTGGRTEDVDDARPVLEVFGKVVHAGPIGSGHAVKALNNLLSATHLLITSEAMLAGERFGLDPKVMLDIFNGSSGRSGSTENKYPNFVLPGTYNSGFGLRLMLKDMKIAVALAAEVDAPSALGAEAVQVWSMAAEDLPPRADHTEIARWVSDGDGDHEE